LRLHEEKHVGMHMRMSLEFKTLNS
jgi:hypothetical protein